MKLSGREAARFASSPDLSLAGVLIYGEDGVEVAARRKQIVDAALGADGEARELRLARLRGADVRKDGAAVLDAMKARGFFAGPQAALVEEATDGCADNLRAALAAASEGDAYLVVTAGVLPARSKLRKLFETAKNAAAAPCYGDAPDGDEIRRLLAAEGDPPISGDALRDLEALARILDAGAFRDLIARLALYHLDDPAPISPGDVAVCAPGAGDADMDDAIDAVIEGRTEAVGPLLARVEAQGRTATGVAIVAGRRLRTLHGLLASGGGPGGLDAALRGLRPPVFGPRRDALLRAGRVWTLPMVESALKIVLEADDQLRGAANASGFAVLERAFLKLALTAARLGR